MEAIYGRNPQIEMLLQVRSSLLLRQLAGQPDRHEPPQESSRASSSRLCLARFCHGQPKPRLGWPVPLHTHSLRSPFLALVQSQDPFFWHTAGWGFTERSAVCECTRSTAPMVLLPAGGGGGPPLSLALSHSSRSNSSSRSFSLFSPHFSRHPFAHNSPSITDGFLCLSPNRLQSRRVPAAFELLCPRGRISFLFHLHCVPAPRPVPSSP